MPAKANGRFPTADLMMSEHRHDSTPGWWLLLGAVIVLFALALMAADGISHVENRLDALEATMAEEHP